METIIKQKSPEMNDQKPESESKDFPTRRALEEFNESTRKHYVTRHGGGTQTDAHVPAAIGPMDHEA